MIHANIPKSPTQHLTYRLRHLVDVREPEGDAEMERKSEPQSSDWKEATERTGRDGFSSLYYKGLSPYFHSDPHAGRHTAAKPCPRRYLPRPLLRTRSKRSARCPTDVLPPRSKRRRYKFPELKKNIYIFQVLTKNWGEVQPPSCSNTGEPLK